MYNSYFPSSIRSNPYNSAYSSTLESYDMHNNQYYSQKIFNDHRLDRKMLQRPAFLIKQKPLYPDSDSYRIGSALDYADSLVRPKTHKFYTEAAQQERVRIQGVNPFYQANPYISSQSKYSYLKRSTRSRLDTNPNLGVTSYEVLPDRQPQNLNSHTQQSPQTIDLSSIKKQKHGIQDYISKSILQNQNSKITQRQKLPPKHNQTIQQQVDDDFFHSKKTSQKPLQPIRKTASTILPPKNNPEQIVYKGKKYISIAV